MARRKSEPHEIIAAIEKQTNALRERKQKIEAELARPQDGDLDAGSDTRFKWESEAREISLRLQRLEIEHIEAQVEIAQQTVAHYQQKLRGYWRQKAEAKQRLRDETRERYPKGWRKVLAQVKPAWYKDLQRQWHNFFAQEKAVAKHARELESRRRELLTPAARRNDWAHMPLSAEELDQRAQAATA